jgi:hypothetical protein
LRWKDLPIRPAKWKYRVQACERFVTTFREKVKAVRRLRLVPRNSSAGNGRTTFFENRRIFSQVDRLEKGGRNRFPASM